MPLSPRKLALTAALAVALAASTGLAQPAREFPPNTWVQVAAEPAGQAPAWSNLVYDPVRQQVLHWGAPPRDHGGAYPVHALDLAGGRWTPDYPSKLIGQALYLKASWRMDGGEPVPHCTFDQVCYDPKRKQVIFAGPNMMMAYDPATRKWRDMGAEVELYGRRHPGGPPVYAGAMAYDPVNDELVLFPHGSAFNLDEHAETGRVTGHFGTFLYSFNDNLWRRTTATFGSQAIRDARAQVMPLQGRIVRAQDLAWQLTIRPQPEKLAALAKTLTALADDLAGWSPPQAADKLKSEAAAAIKAAAGSAVAGKAAEAEDGCIRAMALLDQMLDAPLRVEPMERCFSKLVYDPKSQCIVMFGGEHQDRRLADTWVYDCKRRSWQQRTPAVSPSPRADHAFVYHQPSGMLLLAGGVGDGGADSELWSYDVTANVWQRLQCVAPWKPGTRSRVSHMSAYDAANDLLILKDSAGTTYALRLDLTRKADPTPWTPLPPERQELPPDDPAVLARLKELPANTWTPAEPPKEPNDRDYGNLTCDAATGYPWYCGGGHAAYCGNDIAIYQPGANVWIRSYRPGYSQTMRPFPPGGFYWPDGVPYHGGVWADHFDVYAASNGRCYFPFAVLTPYTNALGSYGPAHFADWTAAWKGKTGREPWPMGYYIFDLKSRTWRLELPKFTDGSWANDRGAIFRSGACMWAFGDGVAQMDISRRVFSSYDPFTRTLHVQRVDRGEPAPPPRLGQGNDIAYCRQRDALLCWVTLKDMSASQTWLYDIKTNKWQQLAPLENAPPLGPCGKVVCAPDQDAVLLTAKDVEQWVYSFKHNAWKPLNVRPHAGRRRTGPFEQIVYSEKYGVFIWTGRRTGLMRPDFSKLDWK